MYIILLDFCFEIPISCGYIGENLLIHLTKLINALIQVLNFRIRVGWDLITSYRTKTCNFFWYKGLKAVKDCQKA